MARKHAEGAVIAAVCGGVFLLADSALLDGRRATTHWMFAGELQRRHPKLRLDSDRLVIDDCDIVTAGGVLACAGARRVSVGTNQVLTTDRIAARYIGALE